MTREPALITFAATLSSWRKFSKAYVSIAQFLIDSWAFFFLSQECLRRLRTWTGTAAYICCFFLFLFLLRIRM